MEYPLILDILIISFSILTLLTDKIDISEKIAILLVPILYVCFSFYGKFVLNLSGIELGEMSLLGSISTMFALCSIVGLMFVVYIISSHLYKIFKKNYEICKQKKN